jgi:hypothetical protein
VSALGRERGTGVCLWCARIVLGASAGAGAGAAGARVGHRRSAESREFIFFEAAGLGRGNEAGCANRVPRVVVRA